MNTFLNNIKSMPESDALVLIKQYILNDLDNYRGYNIENVIRCAEVYTELKTLKIEHLISDILKAYYFDYTNDEYVNFDFYIVLSILNHKVSVSADFAYALCCFCILNNLTTNIPNF
jgi:predicted transcriptional regulator YdeE